MSATPDLTDAQIGELDDLLHAIPEPLEPLDVVMLDGYLCGLLCQPQTPAPEQFLPPAFDWNFGEEGGQTLGPDTAGWHHAKHERLVALVLQRMAALERGLREDGWFDPLVMSAEDDEGRRVIRSKVSRQDLAKVVGASREMVSRVMKDLEERGFIEALPNGATLLKDRLNALG